MDFIKLIHLLNKKTIKNNNRNCIYYNHILLTYQGSNNLEYNV